VWVRGVCQELTHLITAAERMAKSSGDLITWNNCRCSSLLTVGGHYPLRCPRAVSLSCWYTITSPLKIVHTYSREPNDDLKRKR
jgi:hypothetical protein